MIYLLLFWEYFKTGLFAIGGGMATVPFLQDISARTGWFTFQELADMIAVSESTPGPIGINMATYVGFKTAGVIGSAVAVLGLITPSLIVILIVAAFLHAFRNNKYVERVFYGIRPASTGLIAYACLSVMMLCLLNVEAFRASGLFTDLISIKSLILFATLIVLTNFKKLKKLHPIIFIAASAVIGILFNFAG